MTTKKLNTESIQNELTGASAFFKTSASKPATRGPEMPPDDLPPPHPVPSSTSRPRQPKSELDQQPPAIDEGEATKQQIPVRPVHPYGRTDDSGVRPAALAEQIPSVPSERRPERYAFNFWSDQIPRLKKLKQVLNLIGDPDERKEVSLSDLAREAIDEYLARRTKQIRQTTRTDG